MLTLEPRHRQIGDRSGDEESDRRTYRIDGADSQPDDDGR